MKRYLILLSLAFVLACRPAAGPIGPQGPAGSNAPAGEQVMIFQNGMLPSGTYAGCEDTRIWQGAEADVNFSADSYIEAGYTGTGSKRGLFRFDVSGLPASAVIKRAVLTLYCEGVVSGAPAFAFHQVRSSMWSADEATWNSYATGVSWTTAGGDFYPALASEFESPATASYTSWDIIPVSIVNAWQTSENYGLIMTVKDVTKANECIFSSSEAAVMEQRPKLAVYYDLP